jgi:hypothetical protein
MADMTACVHRTRSRPGSRPHARYRTIRIQAGNQIITAADPLPDDSRQAIEAINHGR